MRSWLVVGVCVVAAALARSAPAAAGTPADEGSAPEKVQLLDVPYVPQSEALCGGAAIAMVLRYWGKPGVLAEDFASLVEPGQDGIQTGALVKAVEAYGWTALPLPGTPTEVENHLAHGRPIIALIRAGSGSYHYVVLVAWANGWVIIHDPNVGPFRAIREGEFNAAWSGSASWALLVLPPPGTREQGAPDSATAAPPSLAVPDECGAMMEAGILLAQRGDSAEAELKFLAAQSLWPASAAPLRERAGLRFCAEDWAGASRLAERALALDPSDAHTWRLLAGSRFLAGDVEGALFAWNHVFEPRTDLTRVDGLTRIRFSAVAGQLNLPPGRLLTPHAFRQARRRLAEMPAQSDFRLSMRPMPDGNAQVNVTLLERPLVFEGPWDVVSEGIKALAGREITLDVASPTGNGELWTAGWRWWKNRPRVSLALTVPAAGGRPGIWRLEGFWERQYGFTDRFDAEAKLGFFENTTFVGADGELWILKGKEEDTGLDFSLAGGVHWMFGKDDRFDTMGFDITPLLSVHANKSIELCGALDASFESIKDTPPGVDDTFTRLHLVPGIEYRLSEVADLVGEVGIGLNDDSFTYAGVGIAFYLR